MSDQIIYSLSLLFVTAIIVWALSAYAELALYRTVGRLLQTIRRILRKGRETENNVASDYFIIEGRYKNRKIVCRLSRIAPSTLWNFRLSLHCYVEPLRLPQAPGREKNIQSFYPSTSTTAIQTFRPGERFSEQEILFLFEELSKSAEMIENELP
ncbi:MAG: hypothetical protein WC732_03825 [Candidatus Omnitrophota bacterium]